ncbi:hypothetical protein [uncultured Bradyrhizobium sp.]|uniref:hypothetical protein n=1 Tax=uncultured Bradyrhizobium sp. TaxID=199684 RepID=UPI00262060AA|nr:hypothetical protein [uncultured Bradyrhizobium sp.]
MDADKVRDIVTYTAGAVAVFSLIGALFQSMTKSNGSALPTLLVCAIACVIVFLPMIQQVSFYGVETRMKDKVTEVKAIEDQIKKVAEINARVSYMNIGWGNRLGSPSALDKQAMLDEIDSQLRDLKISDADRKALSATYVKLIGFDFYMMYVRTLERYFSFRQQAMQSEVNKDSGSPVKNELDRWKAGMPSWKPNYTMFENLGTYSFEDEINRVTPTGWLSEADQKATDLYKREIIRLFRSVEEKGGYTKEAAEYYDRYHDLGGSDKKIIQLFGFNPSAVR